MNAETIKDFLISLGFSLDDAGYQKFSSVLTGVTANAIKMGLAVEGAALSVVAFTAKIASGLDNLYWASQRTGATVQGIKQIGYAVSQVGGSVDAARGSLESLARFVRNNPGAEGFLNRLGVQTRDASGNMRDMSAIFTGVGQKLSSMPYYRANQYAQMLGMDENTLMAMRRGASGFTGQYSAMAKAIGFNADEAAKSSNRFMTSLRFFGEMAGMARDKIGSNLAGGLAGSLDTLRRHILDNFPRIEQTLTKAIRGFLWLGDVIGRLFFRLIQVAGDLIEWWGSLNKSTKQLIGMLGALTVAMRILNSTFWMSPIGLVTALAAAIALLWEDYKTWKEGGQSLIDWARWQDDIDYVMKGIGSLQGDFGNLIDKVVELGGSVEAAVKQLSALIGLDFSGFSGKWLFDQIIESVRSSIKEIGALVDVLNKLLKGDFSGAWNSIKEASKLAPSSISSAIGNKIYDSVFGTDKPAQSGQSGKGTLADRNNNPGNIRPVGGGGFRFFESALHGWTAMKNQLMRYFTGKTTGRALRTIQDIVSTWAPAGDKNDPQQYAKQVAGWMGVSPNAVLNLSDPHTMGSLMQSMARKEGYSNWNSPLAYRAAAGSGANIQQQNTYNIYGGGDARAVGNEVERRQQSSNAQVMRGNQTKVG
ncbi:lytic transglycosylase catalytic [Edwardsiella piscicida]|uniref:lytic transglycosylase catalytic n=1 Tax=Edwardsiella piscicida TaxID=1263550 RepID=UPI00101ACCA5|nr:lytic transglycosylase catalytic [Edwardsiella piscicida]QBB13742.1 lytic transglycosylase catalytic [Edwardsiella piscicida]